MQINPRRAPSNVARQDASWAHMAPNICLTCSTLVSIVFLISVCSQAKQESHRCHDDTKPVKRRVQASAPELNCVCHMRRGSSQTLVVNLNILRMSLVWCKFSYLLIKHNMT